MKAVVTDPILLALVERMEVKVNIMEQARRVAEVKRRNITAMIQADYNGLTCKAEGCFDRAEFFGSRSHFCGSHMLIQVGA